ncbi:hypothetical protein [Anaeromyxobacter diazotrophicus]|uniref:Uncharacterized protein n=1 Tax=Anaeromyxobacter diazotrophicus TaxID=2590199 RepID=A0A7I9VNI2_9BACT|nr:hypothetical protein [Anaeromyxobacter diazotrophicus]GEJ57537.1 hypothetical protein AMYX_22780 [Anaeromyxobacter diazotrophicus]
MPNDSAALSMAAGNAEVCFPAWPTPQALVTQVAARVHGRLGAGPLEAATFFAFAVAIPGVVAVLSVAMLCFLLAFVLLAPGALGLLAWGCWRHDRALSRG